MSKNTLITGKSYDLLIKELEFEPYQLLAKPGKGTLKIKSPKTERFIFIGGKAYNDLLSNYKEEDLLKRRDGYIKSPDTDKIIRVFSKTFNNLLDNYELDYLLSLPRVPKGEKKIGLEYNDTQRETIEERIKKIKGLSHLPTSFQLNEEMVNQLIKSRPQVAVFITAIYTQYEDADTDISYESANISEVERKSFKCFYYAGGLYKNGTLVSFCQCKEIRMEPQEFLMLDYSQVHQDITNCQQFFDCVNAECDDNLSNILLDAIDVSSYTQNKLEYVQKQSIDSGTLFDIARSYMWLLVNARMLKIIETKLFKMDTLSIEGENFEEQEEVQEFKTKKLKKIEKLKKSIVEYIENDV